MDTRSSSSPTPSSSTLHLEKRAPTDPRGSAARRLVVTAALAAGGFAAGVAAKAVDISPVPDWLGDLGNFPTAFVLALVLIAWSAPSVLAAALRAALAFVGVCLGYYVWSSVAAGFLNRESALAWTAVSLTAVPLAAAVLRWAARRPGIFAGAALAGVGALLTTDEVLEQMWWVLTQDVAGAQADLWTRPVQVLIQIAGLLLLLVALPPGRRSRLWALALFLPLCILADRLLPQAYTLLPALG